MPHEVTDGSVYAGLGDLTPTTVHVNNGSVSTSGAVEMPLSLNGLGELREIELEKLFALREITANINLSRRELFSALNDEKRDLDGECHFPKGFQDSSYYKELYDGSSIAARVVEVLPKQCFQVTPEVTENEDGEEQTEFEKAWSTLGRSLLPNSGFINGTNGTAKKSGKGQNGKPNDVSDSDSMFDQEQGSPIWSYLLRADILSGIGQYGVIFFGIDDGLPFSDPAEGVEELNSMPGDKATIKEGRDKTRPKDGGSRDGTDAQYTGKYDDRGLYPRYTFSTNANLIKNRRLMYLRVLPESMAEVVSYETNITSPRYGQPTSYRVTFNEYGRSGSVTSGPTGTYNVHWTRVQHVADWYHTADASEILAKPRCEPVLREILSARKPLYASAEGYWKTCMTILIGEFTTPDGTKPPVNAQGMKDFFWRIQNSLQRTGWLENGSLKSIAPTVTDPTPFINILVEAICIKLGIPIRIFKGSERGELASSQDDSQWNDELRNRQNVYITPGIIIPFITRLVMLGVLPRPTGLRIKWPDMDSMTRAQQGTLAQTRTAAMAQYTQADIQSWFPPHEFLTRELGYDDDEAEAILAAGEEHAQGMQEKDMEKQQTMIDEGLAPDPQAPPPEPPPVQMKPGTSLVHPQTGKTIAQGPPMPKPAKPVRNKERKVKPVVVATPVLEVETEDVPLVTNTTLGNFSRKLANWFWSGKK